MVTTLYRHWRVYFIFACIFIAGLVWYIVFSARPFSYLFFHHSQQLRFVMLDIGQGDALYIQSPTGNQIIVDGGPGDALLGQLGKVMPVFDRSIDMIINTNPDRDHFEGFVPLLDRYSVGMVMEAGTDAESNPLWRLFETKITEQKIPRMVARKGQRIDIGGGAYIDILFPDRDVKTFSHNDGSIVARLMYGKTSVLLTGDTTQKIEKYLVMIDPGDINVDILKAGHHGSKTSTSPELVKVATPMVTLISAGKDNQFGHPNKETLDTLDKYHVPYLVTFNEGAIEYDSDGEKFVRVK